MAVQGCLMGTGDVERLAMFWTGAQPAVAASVRSLVPDSHQMQDVLQQVALVVVRGFAEYDATRPFSAWAIGVAKQKVLSYRRQRRTDRHVFDDARVEQIALIYERTLAQNVSDRRRISRPPFLHARFCWLSWPRKDRLSY